MQKRKCRRNNYRNHRHNGKIIVLRIIICWDFPAGAVDKTLCSQCRGPGVRSLVSELDSTYMPQLRPSANK